MHTPRRDLRVEDGEHAGAFEVEHRADRDYPHLPGRGSAELAVEGFGTVAEFVADVRVGIDQLRVVLYMVHLPRPSTGTGPGTAGAVASSNCSGSGVRKEISGGCIAAMFSG